MESAINKENAIAAMDDQSGETDNRTPAGILVALIEIRKAIEDGFARLETTSVEAAMMLVGCKETFDGYVRNRLNADKVLAGVVAAMTAKGPKNGEKPDGPVDEPKKSAVTLNDGSFGGSITGDSGI